MLARILRNWKSSLPRRPRHDDQQLERRCHHADGGKAELRDENNNPVRIGRVYPPEYVAKVVLPGIVPSGTTKFTARVISSVLELPYGQTYTLTLTMSELTATTSGLRTTEGEYKTEIRTPERPD